MRIIFIGGPGTGKSTVGKRLAGDLGWPWISSGEILRESKEPWVIERLKTAQLFDDEMVTQLVLSRLDETENAIIDGFPRTLKQAENMVERGYPADILVDLSVPIEEAITRLVERGRDQDTPEIIRQRWDEFNETKAQIEAYLGGNGVRIVAIDGVGTQEEVYQRAVAQIHEAMEQLNQ